MHKRFAVVFREVLPGHEDRRHEEIVEDHGDYLIVAAKPDHATEIALETA
jgi:hypothetical protein